MVVAAGDDRRARGRAERRGVEIRVTQPVLRDAIHCRCRNDAAERARRAEAHVVSHRVAVDPAELGVDVLDRHLRAVGGVLADHLRAALLVDEAHGDGRQRAVRRA